MKVHLVLYATGEPYETTKKLTIESCPKHFAIHEYNLEKIKKSSWFHKIEDLPNEPHKEGRRDGYYCAYKAHIIKEVYDEYLEEGDKLLYVDCSQHYRKGFTESLDELLKYDMICGSASTDFKNFSHLICQNVDLWNKIYPGQYRLFDVGINASFLFFTKNSLSTRIIHEYAEYNVNPWVKMHISGDQAILTVIVYKYNLPVFFHPNVKHFESRDKNLIIRHLNAKKQCVYRINSINPFGYKEEFSLKWEKNLHMLRIFCNQEQYCYAGTREEFKKFFKNVDTQFDETKKYSCIYVDEKDPDLWKYYNCLEDRGLMIVDNVGVEERVNFAVWHFRPFIDTGYDTMYYVKNVS